MPSRLVEIRAAALDYLARREHSRAELRHKLIAKAFSATAIETVLDALQAEGLQSDPRFAESYVYSRVQRGYGPLRLRQELQQRGVDAGLARDVIAAGAYDWYALARQIRRKHFGPSPPRDLKDKVRQLRFLGSHGFDHDQAYAALAEADEET